MCYTAQMIVVTGKHRSKHPVRILLIVSIIFWLVASCWFGYNFWFITHADVADGVVMQLIPRGKYRFTPLVQFRTGDGQLIEFHQSFSQNPPPYTIGDRVTVYYFPEHPTRAKIANWVGLWLGPVLFSIAAFAESITTLVIWRKLIHKRRQ
jgi:hypothetical protein